MEKLSPVWLEEVLEGSGRLSSWAKGSPCERRASSASYATRPPPQLTQRIVILVGFGRLVRNTALSDNLVESLCPMSASLVTLGALVEGAFL